jgi:hypothetical protein
MPAQPYALTDKQAQVLDVLRMGPEWTAAALTKEGVDLFCDPCDGTGEGLLNTRDACPSCHGTGLRWLCYLEIEQTLERLVLMGRVGQRRERWLSERASLSGWSRLAVELSCVAQTRLLAEQSDVSGRAGRLSTGDRLRPRRARPGGRGLPRVLLDEQGDVAGARDAYQRAIDSRHPRVGPLALQALETLEG